MPSKAIACVVSSMERNSRKAKFLSRLIWHASTGLPAACARPDRCICWLKNSIISSSVTPNGMLPTYRRRACLVIVDPTTGTAACGVSATMLAGIWPAACIALYCRGVMCSKPGGGTSQYSEGFLRRDRPPLLLFGERERLRRRLSRGDRERRLSLRRSRSKRVEGQCKIRG